MLWPGSPMWRSSAAAKGELRPAPSIATAPGAVEKAMNEPRVESNCASPASATPSGSARCGCRLLHERVVAAGIEEHQAGLGLLLHDVEDVVDRHRLEPQLHRRVEPGIDRHDEVAAVDLQAVAGIEEQPDVRAFERIGELADLALQRALAEIVALDDLEADLAQPCRDVGGVIDRIGQRAGFLIGAVADDQRDAAFLLRVAPQQQEPQKRQREKTSLPMGKHHSASRRTGATVFGRSAMS